MSHNPCMGVWGMLYVCRHSLLLHMLVHFLYAMSRPTFINSNVVYHDNSTEYNIDARGKDAASVIRACETDNIESVQEEPSDSIDSIIFTKKAKQEKKEASIIEALQKSIQGRKDKTRAFVRELQSWQKEAYIDAHYNAQVMYDELAKIIPLPFGYEVFKKHYNNTRY